MFGRDKNKDAEQKQKITYLIGDFSKATVFVGSGLFGSRQVDPESLKKEVHDESLKGETFRFWNAAPKYHKELAKKPNAFIFAGDLSNKVFEMDHSGIAVTPVPDLDR